MKNSGIIARLFLLSKLCYFYHMKKMTFAKEVKERLDKFLVDQLPELSRNQIQKMIKNDGVLVNGRKVEPHHFLKINDQIEIIAGKKNKIQSKKQPLIPEIIGETDDYLVINKPAGLTVHPAEHTEKNEATLTDWLVKKYPLIKDVGDNALRPGIVHRLDKDVSGLMVIAKNQKMFEHLKEQFKSRRTLKEYLALVYGQIIKNEGQIDFPLLRAKHSGKMAARPKGDIGRTALTEFTVSKKFANYTYLNVVLKTGRTHQIRAHFNAYDHPLVGDKLYGQKKFKDKFNLERVFLHASRLGFYDLTKTWQEFASQLPDELTNILNTLK